MSNQIRLLVVDDIAETRDNIKRLLYFEQDIVIVGEAGNGEEAVRQTEKLKPDIVLMDINMPVMDGITATEVISLKNPKAAVIIMSVQGEQEYLKKAMSAGAREYMVKPFSGDELAETIRKVHEIEKKRKAIIPERISIIEKKEPEIITVVSTKGGVGRTTIATNLAVTLAQETKKKVVVVDLDLQFGDIAVMLNVIPKRTITELVQEIGQMDADLLESYLVPHPTGIKILPAPTRPEYAELVIGSHVEKILNLLKQNYDYIIVDTPTFFHETNLTALDAANQILVVVTMDLPTIKNVKLCMEVMESLHHKGKVKMVLNRSSEDIGIKHRDVETSMGFLIAAHVPSDGRLVISSVNKGIPFVTGNPNARISQSFKDLAKMVINNEGDQDELHNKERKKGLINRLFG